MNIVDKLMIHMNKSEGEHYRDELLAKIIEICSQNDHQYITNFEWLVFIFLVFLLLSFVLIHIKLFYFINVGILAYW